MEGVPGWVWVGVVLIAAPFGAFAMVLAAEYLSKRPVALARLGSAWVEVVKSERRLPRRVDLVVAPVATDLRMAAGIAKWVKDATANAAQQAADAAGSRPVGSALLAPGGRYRFRNTALAVMLDEGKRFTAAGVEAALVAALTAGRAAGATTAVIPDIVDDLMLQAQTITLEDRRRLARALAPAVVGAVATAGTLGYEQVTLWSFRAGVEDIYAEALLAAGPEGAAAQPA